MDKRVLQFKPGGKLKADAERQALQAALTEAATAINDRLIATVKHGIETEPEILAKIGPGPTFITALAAVLGVDLSQIVAKAPSSPSPEQA
jgi:hypothetical protein